MRSVTRHAGTTLTKGGKGGWPKREGCKVHKGTLLAGP